MIQESEMKTTLVSIGKAREREKKFKDNRNGVMLLLRMAVGREMGGGGEFQ
jgi:hypothetical protein